ncbi:hypothetical protein VP01_2254g7 [Puccinia sorghi]|uniref:HAT C-terminal dimerisation domain-containing protein n=1 Tax=Puccinia sorghi TaxID=27349 RepID=A0A0L6VAA8_9BASI|nr:hypothetical protein VP01_2254g7 [Puccinia sorghi]
MHKFTVAVPHIQGTHTGEKFAKLFHNILKKYVIVDQLHTITTNNALVKTKMATELHLQVPSFNTKLNLLGCVAHIIKLAAKIGISILGPINQSHDGENLSTQKMDSDGIWNPLDISFVTSPANGADINSKKIVARIHGLLTWFKTTFWINNASFFEEQYNMLVNNIINIFETKCKKFVSLQSSGREQPAFESAATEPQPSNYFASKLYQPPHNVCGVPAKINQYLKEDIEPEGVKFLTYWANQCKNFPNLAKMAFCFLSIPATSAASKQVFSNGGRIISCKRAALQPASIEELLCLKDWFQAFNGPF